MVVVLVLADVLLVTGCCVPFPVFYVNNNKTLMVYRIAVGYGSLKGKCYFSMYCLLLFDGVNIGKALLFWFQYHRKAASSLEPLTYVFFSSNP